MRLRYAALSDVGRVRRDNQDSGYAGPHLLVIADGVGGSARGDIASTATVEVLRRSTCRPATTCSARWPARSTSATTGIAGMVAESPEIEGTSTTVTAAIFDGTQLGVGHVGDSRGYLLRDGTLSQLTTDHTFVQSLIDEGRITEDEARVHPHRNLILRAVDGVHEPEPDVFTLQVAPGDRILLCSDGCSGVLSDQDLATILGDGTPDHVAVSLVSASLDAGSSDNVTVVVADVVGDDAVDDEETSAPPPSVRSSSAPPPRSRVADGRRAAAPPRASSTRWPATVRATTRTSTPRRCATPPSPRGGSPGCVARRAGRHRGPPRHRRRRRVAVEPEPVLRGQPTATRSSSSRASRPTYPA